MKKLALLIFLAALMGCQKTAEKKAVMPQTKQEMISYSIGMDVGESFLKQKLDLLPEFVAEGIEHGLSGQEPLLPKEQRDSLMNVFQEEMMNKQASDRQALGEKNKIEGEAFLAANKEKEGVITTPSGLQYKVIVEGKGPIPKADDVVETHYRGTLINGQEFDSSYKRGQTASFPVSRVIKGWTEALQMMKVGSKWQLFVPPDLGYGASGAGQDIGPNATLIFDIELIGIK